MCATMNGQHYNLSEQLRGLVEPARELMELRNATVAYVVETDNGLQLFTLDNIPDGARPVAIIDNDGKILRYRRAS